MTENNSLGVEKKEAGFLPGERRVVAEIPRTLKTA